MGSNSYALRSLLNNKSAVAIPIFEAPNANALQLSTDVRATMAELSKEFPEGVEYSIVYDPTQFVRESIDSVIHTLFEAILLVALVVIVFLQSWRASVIPLLAVPVSVVGTFAVMLMFGFSINTLSLFGLVLAIGIVVDDAIVVVENVERNISNGLESARRDDPGDEGSQSGPIIAIALVLCAVFVPIAFVSGLTGQFYRQFALTIAISTVISAFCLADAGAGPVGRAAEAARRAEGPRHARHRRRLRALLRRLQPLLRPRFAPLRRRRADGPAPQDPVARRVCDPRRRRAVHVQGGARRASCRSRTRPT